MFFFRSHFFAPDFILLMMGLLMSESPKIPLELVPQRGLLPVEVDTYQGPTPGVWQIGPSPRTSPSEGEAVIACPMPHTSRSPHR